MCVCLCTANVTSCVSDLTFDRSQTPRDNQTKVPLTMVFVSEAYAPRVDVSGLVAGIMAVLVSAVIATVLGIYFYKAKNKSGSRSALLLGLVRMDDDS